jgi:hypothetical protein
VTPDEAQVLLALAREARWDFPSSFELDWLREQLACAEN